MARRTVGSGSCWRAARRGGRPPPGRGPSRRRRRPGGRRGGRRAGGSARSRGSRRPGAGRAPRGPRLAARDRSRWRRCGPGLRRGFWTGRAVVVGDRRWRAASRRAGRRCRRARRRRAPGVLLRSDPAGSPSPSSRSGPAGVDARQVMPLRPARGFAPALAGGMRLRAPLIRGLRHHETRLRLHGALLSRPGGAQQPTPNRNSRHQRAGQAECGALEGPGGSPARGSHPASGGHLARDGHARPASHRAPGRARAKRGDPTTSKTVSSSHRARRGRA